MGSTRISVNEHQVAVYGSLKAGRYNHGYLRTATFIGRFRTAPEYTMIDLGAYPAIISNGRTAIEVEVYGVDSDTLRALDELEEHPDCYQRVRVQIAKMEVFIYVLTKRGIREFKNLGLRIVKSGRW